MTKQEQGFDAEYDRNRKIVMAEERDCGICGGEGLPDDQADHIVQRSQGGTNERNNLRRAHRVCNVRRLRVRSREKRAHG
jgi:5-methylcytosine-specific restriction endonuclease McrA